MNAPPCAFCNDLLVREAMQHHLHRGNMRPNRVKGIAECSRCAAIFSADVAEPTEKERPLPRCNASLFTTGMLAVPLLAMSAPALAVEPVHVSAVAVAAKEEFCRITGSSATVRAEPRNSAKALGTAYKGNACISHGWAEDEVMWVKVTIKRTGVVGYAHSSLVVWGEESLTATGR
ncbi:SH3 domain-containing protein [Streptomyces puniciscabiei]